MEESHVLPIENAQTGKQVAQDKSMVSVLPHVPFEIMAEIMTWLPVISLMRFKCVCRQFCTLICQDLQFIEKHRKRTTPERLNVEQIVEDSTKIPMLNGNKYEIFPLQYGFHGLMVVKDLASQFYYLRNPSTRHILCLPDPPEGTNFFVPASSIKTLLTGDCKLLSYYRNYTESGFQILSVNRDKHWRPLKLPDDDDQQGQLTVVVMRKRCFVFDIGLTSTSVCLWMKIYKDGLDHMCLKVLSFDIMDERFSTMTLPSFPRGFFSDLLEVHLMSWNGCPAVAELTNEALNVMVFERDNKEKKLTGTSRIVVPLRFLRENLSMKDQLVCSSANSNVLTFTKHGEYFCYDMKSEMFWATRTKTFLFKPSLVTLEGMIPEKPHRE